jgi:hypothetical protein
LFPAFAQAVVRVNIERIDVIPTGAAQTVFLDVFGVDLDNSNEQLTAFTVGIDAPTFSANGVRFDIPGTGLLPKPGAAHPFVFSDFAGVEVDDFGSTFNRIQGGSALAGSTQQTNLSDLRNGLVRLPILIPANAAPGVYAITLDPTVLDLAGQGPPVVAVPGDVGQITIVPEPASLGLVVLGGLLTLRRRRVA